jgi:hypothetical protein
MLTPNDFDPKSPLPRRTLANILATGEGRASSARLGVAAAVGAGGALVVLALVPAWWLLASPLTCVGALGVWGLAAQKTHQLDVARRSAPMLRRWLRAVRIIAALVGGAAAVAGVLGVFASLSPR